MYATHLLSPGDVRHEGRIAVPPGQDGRRHHQADDDVIQTPEHGHTVSGHPVRTHIARGHTLRSANPKSILVKCRINQNITCKQSQVVANIKR